MEMEGAELPPQGDELPDAQPDLPVARPVLPRAAAAALRVRRRLPQREVRRRARPDPRARHDPGRLPLLRHPRAGAGRDQAPARLLPRPLQRLRARRLLPRAVHPRRLQARQVRRLRRGVGGWPPRCSRRSPPSPASSWCPTPAARRTTGPKISVQARDAIGRTWQMSTIQYDFNQPRGFELEYQAADGTRQQPVMIHSAKFGSIERFIGVLVEHYAGAFPPWLAPVQVQGDPDRRAPRRLPRTSRRADAGARAARRGRRLRRPDAEEDPQRPAAEGAVHDDRRRRRRRGRRGVVPLPRRSTRTTASPSTRPSPRVAAAVGRAGRRSEA